MGDEDAVVGHGELHPAPVHGVEDLVQARLQLVQGLELGQGVATGHPLAGGAQEALDRALVGHGRQLVGQGGQERRPLAADAPPAQVAQVLGPGIELAGAHRPLSPPRICFTPTLTAVSL